MSGSPRTGVTARAQTGDGDPCPLDPEHGKMIVARDRQTQWCPNQGHDGNPKSAVGGATPRTPARWPLGTHDMAAAVAAYHDRVTAA